MTTRTIPSSIDDPINLAILRISEDQLSGFQRDPYGVIAEQSGIEINIVLERIQAMLEAGTIRRVRQTLNTTKLAAGALVAWSLPEDRLQQAFDYMFERDPFSGHVVLRTTDDGAAGARYRLWTTLKTPQGYSLEKHARFLTEQTGATDLRIMPAHKVFALGVGHMRRRGLPPGSRSEKPGPVLDTEVVGLTRAEWKVLTALKRDVDIAEIQQNVWSQRAEEAEATLQEFCDVAEGMDSRGLVGRFSTFLDHVKGPSDGEPVTRYNALFHWAVPPGRELDSGR